MDTDGFTKVTYKKTKKSKKMYQIGKRCDFCKVYSNEDEEGLTSINSEHSNLYVRHHWQKWNSTMTDKVPLWFCSFNCLYNEKQRYNARNKRNC